jgi:DNA modification methylase
VLTGLLSELQLRRKDRETDFWTVVRKLAAGERLTVAAIERLLAENGKTPSDLQAGVELAVRAIQYSSRPGEHVLDLFGGGGSTLIAAEQTAGGAS